MFVIICLSNFLTTGVIIMSGVKKHPVEYYKHYTIYLISGISPTFFLAEKKDPSKGATLSAETLEDLKKSIDKTLEYALSININIYEGPEDNVVLQNPSVHINTNGLGYDGIAIVVTADYDLDAFIEFINNRPIRRSKKHRKTRRHTINVIRLMYRNCTVHQK